MVRMLIDVSVNTLFSSGHGGNGRRANKQANASLTFCCAGHDHVCGHRRLHQLVPASLPGGSHEAAE